MYVGRVLAKYLSSRPGHAELCLVVTWPLAQCIYTVSRRIKDYQWACVLSDKPAAGLPMLLKTNPVHIYKTFTYM